MKKLLTLSVAILAASALSAQAGDAKEIYEKITSHRVTTKAQTRQPITKLGVDEIHLEVHDSSPAPPAAAGAAAMSQPPSVAGGEKIGRG